jgi:hypothetical protein
MENDDEPKKGNDQCLVWPGHTTPNQIGSELVS